MRNFGPYSARMDLSLSFPRIHDLGSKVGKVFDVSGSNDISLEGHCPARVLE
jgi:hypothetical protein